MIDHTKLELKITGSEEELRGYLTAAHYHAILAKLDQLCRDKLKHGHNFESKDAVLEWVRRQLADVE